MGGVFFRYRPRCGIIWSMPNDPQHITLIEELAKHKGKTVYLGVKSSFFFVGPCEEAIRDISFLDIVERSYAAFICRKTGFAQRGPSSSDEKSVADRRVVKVYPRDSGEKGEVVILLEGRGFGMFWTRREYLAGRDVLQKAIDSASKTA